MILEIFWGLMLFYFVTAVLSVLIRKTTGL